MEYAENCQWQFNTFEINQDGAWNQVLDHVKANHNIFMKSNLKWGDGLSVLLNSSLFDEALKNPNPSLLFMPRFYEVANESNIPSDIFVLFMKFQENSHKQIALTLAFGMLTSERHSKWSSFHIKLRIVGQPKPEICHKWGTGCIPDISWTMKPMDMQKLKRLVKIPKKKRPSFPYSIPISHIQRYYMDCNGVVHLTLSFHGT